MMEFLRSVETHVIGILNDKDDPKLYLTRLVLARHLPQILIQIQLKVTEDDAFLCIDMSK